MTEGYICIKQVCSICGNKHVSVQPKDMIRNGQCPNCGHFTCENINESMNGEEEG